MSDLTLPPPPLSPPPPNPALTHRIATLARAVAAAGPGLVRLVADQHKVNEKRRGRVWSAREGSPAFPLHIHFFFHFPSTTAHTPLTPPQHTERPGLCLFGRWKGRGRLGGRPA